MRFNLANVIVLLWSAVVGSICLILPLLAEPMKTYAGHAMYLTLFAGIGAAIFFVKMRTGSFPSLTPINSPVKSRIESMSAGLLWLAVYLVAGVGAGSALKYSGWVGDRRTLLFVVLCAPAVVIAGYYAYHCIRRRPVN